MTDEMWNSPDVRCLGVRLNGDAIDEVNERGERITGDSLALLLNAGEDPVSFVLPATRPDERWDMLIDTNDPSLPPRRLTANDRYDLQSRSMAVLRLRSD
jgi:glycogen operon protein